MGRMSSDTSTCLLNIIEIRKTEIKTQSSVNKDKRVRSEQIAILSIKNKVKEGSYEYKLAGTNDPKSQSKTTHPIKCFSDTKIILKNISMNKQKEEVFVITKDILLIATDNPTNEQTLIKVFSESKNFYMLFDILHKCSLGEFINKERVIHTIEYKGDTTFNYNKANLDFYHKETLSELEIYSNELILNYGLNSLKENRKQRELLIKNLLSRKGGLKILSIFINKGIINEEDVYLIKSLCI